MLFGDKIIKRGGVSHIHTVDRVFGIPAQNGQRQGKVMAGIVPYRGVSGGAHRSLLADSAGLSGKAVFRLFGLISGVIILLFLASSRDISQSFKSSA